MLENAPAEYSMVLTCEQRVKGSALKIEDLQEAMSQMYRTMYGNKVNTDADTEIGLASNDGSNTFRSNSKSSLFSFSLACRQSFNSEKPRVA